MKIQTIAFCLFSLVSTASAQGYKCTHQGKSVYQDMPCGPIAQAVSITFQRESWASCYEVQVQGFAGGPGHVEIMEIRPAGAGFKLQTPNKKSAQLESAIPLRYATSQELEIMRQKWSEERLAFKTGLMIDMDPRSENYKPTGIFKGNDQAGKEVYVFDFFIGVGRAQKTACP